jgi:hypothetical protein
MAANQSPLDQIVNLIRLGLPPTAKAIVAIGRIHVALTYFLPYAQHRGVDVSTVASFGAAKISLAVGGSPTMWISLSATTGGPLELEPALETALISKNGTDTTFSTHIQTWDDKTSMFDYMIKTLTTTIPPEFCTHIQGAVGSNLVTPTLVGCVVGNPNADKEPMVVTLTEDGLYTTYEAYSEWKTVSHSDLGAVCEYLGPPKRSKAKARRDRKNKREQT